MSTACIYQTSNANSSSDRLHRQFTHSSACLTSMPSSANSLGMEQTTRPQSRQQTRNQIQTGQASDTVGVGGGPRTQRPSPPVPAMDLSWALALPEASDLDWDFEAGDFQHMTEVDENSSAAGNVPCIPGSGSCTLLTRGVLQQVWTWTKKPIMAWLTFQVIWIHWIRLWPLLLWRPQECIARANLGTPS